MNNRWGRIADPKTSSHSSGQNNINININFTALKEKANIFSGKKIDNFIEVHNDPKSNPTKPTISS
jgi:hypothetical protein